MMASCPANRETFPVLLTIYLVGLLTTESFCSAVGQHCQGQGGQDDKQIELRQAWSQNRLAPCLLQG